jgi:hypothetical protein
MFSTLKLKRAKNSYGGYPTDFFPGTHKNSKNSLTGKKEPNPYRIFVRFKLTLIHNIRELNNKSFDTSYNSLICSSSDTSESKTSGRELHRKRLKK